MLRPVPAHSRHCSRSLALASPNPVRKSARRLLASGLLVTLVWPTLMPIATFATTATAIAPAPHQPDPKLLAAGDPDAALKLSARHQTIADLDLTMTPLDPRLLTTNPLADTPAPVVADPGREQFAQLPEVEANPTPEVPEFDTNPINPNPSGQPWRSPNSDFPNDPLAPSFNWAPGISDRNVYALGPGDEVQVDVFNAPELNTETNQYTILVDGTVNLPWVGRIFVQGLNLEEAGRTIALEYSEFLRDPVVTVALITARPSRIAVVGEVNRPGAYTSGAFATSGAYATGPVRAAGGGAAQVQVGELRTVIEALQTAGGITQLADIRNIQVQRLLPNGDRTARTIDLWALLQEGDLSQDLTLRDGDTVLVPMVTGLNPEELQDLAAASFSPDAIRVNVVGEVDVPGAVVIPPNTSLNQAIFAAGGFDNARARRSRVRLIRLNADGSVTDRQVAIDLSDNVNEDTNPALRNNDIVVVSRSGLSQSADFLDILGTIAGAVINPVRGVVDIIDTLDNIRFRGDQRDELNEDDDDDEFEDINDADNF